MITDFLSGLLSVAVVIFAATSMLSVGLGNSIKEILRPLRNVGAVIRILLANFILVPLLAFAILQFVSLDRPLEVGLALIATSAGAPFLIKLAEVAEAPGGISAALLVILLPITVLYMPIVVPLAVPGTAVQVSAIVFPLVVTMLLPLAVGLFVRTRRQSWAQRLAPIMGKTATVALLVLVLTTLLANSQAIIDLFGEGAILASLLVIGGAFVIGYSLGSNPETRTVLGLGTAQRNIAAATVVATQSIDDPRTVVMVVITALVGFAILFPTARLLRKRRKI